MSGFEKDHMKKDIEHEIIIPMSIRKEKITATDAVIFLIFVSSVSIPVFAIGTS